MRQIDVKLMIDDLTFTSGKDEVLRAELIKGYGFVADQFNADLDFNVVKDQLGKLFARTDEPVEVSARFTIPGASLRFRGLLDPVDGIRDGGEPRGGTVNISARSILARVLDDEEDTRIDRLWSVAKKSWWNTTWSQVVREIVGRLGFTTQDVHDCAELAGVRQDGGWMLEGTEKFPREIIEGAVKATGYVANVRADGSFLFLHPSELAEDVTDTSVFHIGRPGATDDLKELRFRGKNANSFTSRTIQPAEPGMPIRVQDHDMPWLSGRYYPTTTRYQASPNPEEELVNCDIVRELPSLKEDA